MGGSNMPPPPQKKNKNITIIPAPCPHALAQGLGSRITLKRPPRVAQTRCRMYVDRDVVHWLMLVSKIWCCSLTKFA